MSTSRFFHVLLLLTATAVAAQAQPSAPPDSGALAQAHHDAGRRAFDAGDLVEAVQEFTAAYALHPAPVLLFNIAVSQERLGMARDAAEAYRRYLAAAPGAANRAVVEQHLLVLEQRVPAPPPVVVSPEMTPPPPSVVQPRAANPNALSLEPMRQGLEARRATGRVLTIMGIINGVICSIGLTSMAGNVVMGSITAGMSGFVGTMLLALGLPLWSNAQWGLDQLKVVLQPMPGGGGTASLSMRF